MRRWRLLILALVTMVTAGAAPASAGADTVERIPDVSTVVAVAFPDNFPVASLSRADCAFVQRVTHPDGSSSETQTCDLSDEPVMITEFQGTAPDRALVYEGGACEWLSDFAFAKDGTDEYAESYRVVVTPSGTVHASSWYPAEVMDCE